MVTSASEGVRACYIVMPPSTGRQTPVQKPAKTSVRRSPHFKGTENLSQGAEVLLGGESRKAIADQLTTVSKTRLSVRIEQLTRSDLKKSGNAIRVQLGLVSDADLR